MSKPLVPKTLGLPKEMLDELQRRADILNQQLSFDSTERQAITGVDSWEQVTWPILLRHGVQDWIDNTASSFKAPKKKAPKKKAKRGKR